MFSRLTEPARQRCPERKCKEMLQLGVHYILPGFLVGFIPWLLLATENEDYIPQVLFGLVALWVLPGWGTLRRRYVRKSVEASEGITPFILLAILIFFSAVFGNGVGLNHLPQRFGFKDWKEKLKHVRQKDPKPLQSPEVFPTLKSSKSNEKIEGE